LERRTIIRPFLSTAINPDSEWEVSLWGEVVVDIQRFRESNDDNLQALDVLPIVYQSGHSILDA
jgi:hypothetical protein